MALIVTSVISPVPKTVIFENCFKFVSQTSTVIWEKLYFLEFFVSRQIVSSEQSR